MSDIYKDNTGGSGDCTSSCNMCASEALAGEAEKDGPVFTGRNLVLASILAFIFPIFLSGSLAWILRYFLPDTPAGQAGLAGIAIAGLVIGGAIAAIIIKRMNKQVTERSASDCIGQ